MQKPKLEISANEEYTQEEVKILAKNLDQLFATETCYLAELSEAAIGAMLLFAFQGITSGFFEAIGEKIWYEISEQIADLVISKASPQQNSDVEFTITPQKTTFRVSTNDREVALAAIKTLPEALKSAEKKAEEKTYHQFDNESRKWREDE